MLQGSADADAIAVAKKAELQRIAADADAIAVWASGFPPSDGMPDGYRTTKSLAPFLPGRITTGWGRWKRQLRG